MSLHIIFFFQTSHVNPYSNIVPLSFHFFFSPLFPSSFFLPPLHFFFLTIAYFFWDHFTFWFGTLFSGNLFSHAFVTYIFKCHTTPQTTGPFFLSYISFVPHFLSNFFFTHTYCTNLFFYHILSQLHNVIYHIGLPFPLPSFFPPSLSPSFSFLSLFTYPNPPSRYITFHITLSLSS